MVIPYGYNFSHTKITVFNSGHPVPDENGEFAAKTMSFNTMLLTTYLEGEAKEVTHALSSIVKEIKNSSNPVDIPGQLLLVERQLLRLQEMALADEIKSSFCHLLLMCRVCQVFLWQHMQQTEGMDPLMLLAHLQQEQRLQEPGLWELTQYYFF
jgi:hypothetical protein